MKNYVVYIDIPVTLEVAAASETDAKRAAEKQLIDMGLISPCSPIKMQVVEVIENEN